MCNNRRMDSNNKPPRRLVVLPIGKMDTSLLRYRVGQKISYCAPNSNYPFKVVKNFSCIVEPLKSYVKIVQTLQKIDLVPDTF